MADCSICGEKISEGSRTCAVCGSSADDFFPSATMLGQGKPAAAPVTPMPVTPPGGSVCPGCAKVYGPEHSDPYCVCGIELIRAGAGTEPPMAPILDDLPQAQLVDELPLAPILDDELAGVGVMKRAAKPASGTPCLVLYGPDRQPLQYFALTKDAMLIGRLDAVAGNFPDIDLDAWFDRATIRKISRQHALILRTRATASFSLRPVPGNTGTQLETQMVQSQHDYPLRPGHRLILGGVIRLKFEIA